MSIFAIVTAVESPIVPPSIVGAVSVLFVSVCEPVRVATVESIAYVISLFDTVVSIPVPPVNVRVSLVLNVSLEPLSAASVKELEIVSNSKVPEPFVFRNCPAEPSAAGKVNVVLDEREFAAFSPIKCVPLFVPSLIFNVPPVVAFYQLEVHQLLCYCQLEPPNLQ